MVTSIEDLTPAYLTDALGATVTDAAIEPVGVGVGLIGQLYRITPTYAAGGAGPGDASSPSSRARPRSRASSRWCSTCTRRSAASTASSRRRAASCLPRRTTCASRTRPTTSCSCSTTSATTARPTRSTASGSPTPRSRSARSLVSNATWWEHPDLLAGPYVRPLNESPFPEAVSMSYDAAWPVALEAYGSMMSDDDPRVRRPLLEPLPVVLRPAVRVARDPHPRRLARRQPLLHRRSRRPARRGRLAADLGRARA